jgi:hypothetical protein
MNPTEILIDVIGDRLEESYQRVFGSYEPLYPKIISTSARIALEHIANSDALYHDVMHTIQVALVSQEILRGKHLVSRVTPEDWLHFTIAALFHDIGYVRGICSGDSQGSYVINEAGDTISPPRGATDAFLTPYHVDRGKIFVRERATDVPYIDAERIAQSIELTRFPVPDSEDHNQTNTEAGLVRAADLIGQLGDPHYLRKANHLYQEFRETGVADQLGYKTAADLADDYPRFFWDVAYKYLKDAIHYLQLTQEGKQWVANLHSHVFEVEHKANYLGPCRGDQG